MPILTLTTDFGVGSPYVAAMKGVVLSINPAATVVDITHAVPPQDVRYAAIVLDDVAERFPEGTIHVAVVDPGVGTDRGLVLAEIGRQRFLAPDNGLLSRLAARTRPSNIVRLAEPQFWLPEVSATFHGRDILAPAAARLSLGLDPDRLGVPQDRLTVLDWPEVRLRPEGIDGSILWIDAFGNLISDITRAMLAGHPAWDRAMVCCRQARVEAISRTYADHPPGTLVALIGSSDRLELAVVGGSAAARLGAGFGDRVELRWEADLDLGSRPG